MLLATAFLAAYGLYHVFAAHGYRFNFHFLMAPAGVEISEGYTLTVEGLHPTIKQFEPTDTNTQALIVALYNTLKIAIVGILASTVFGLLLAIGRISKNWLLRQSCFVLLEAIRNTPLLIQLVFWYFAVFLQFPAIADAVNVYGIVIASQNGVVIPSLAIGDISTAAVMALLFAVLCCMCALLVPHLRMYRKPMLCIGIAIGLASIVFGDTLRLELPLVDRFSTSGGTRFTPELVALFLGLSVNTAAYIAEAVRGAINALPKGQWEAAAALGLGYKTTLSTIVVPQVFRIVLPTLGNQYISLLKSTSFGIAIGYPDLFNVSGTLANQTGRTLESIVIVLVAYVLLSWLISACINVANRHLRYGGGVK